MTVEGMCVIFKVKCLIMIYLTILTFYCDATFFGNNVTSFKTC